MNSMFNLGKSDVIKGLATAIFGGAVLGLIAFLQSVFGAPNFDLFSVDWVLAFHSAVNAAVVGAEAGFTGYLVKNFFSDNTGAVLGKFGGQTE